MADLASSYEGHIQIEETQFTAAASEYTMTRLGKNQNYILDYHIFEHAFKMNKTIFGFAGGVGVDGIFVFPYDAEIVDAILYLETPGGGGDLTLDVQTSLFPSGAWTSIFSTQPSINAAAAAFSTVGVGDSVPFTTAPVLVSSPLIVSTKTRMRMSVPSMQSGAPANAGILIKYRPR